MGEVSIFSKLEKTSGQTIRLVKIRTVALFYPTIAALSSNFFVAFYALDISYLSILKKSTKELKTFRLTRIEGNSFYVLY